MTTNISTSFQPFSHSNPFFFYSTMSGWDQWVTFMHGTAANTYAEKKGADSSPATWYISIGDQNSGKYNATRNSKLC